jgi:exodeoxyribonuclease-3
MIYCMENNCGVWRPEREARQVKVFSYNILEGGGDRLAAIGEVIRREQPDAVALLEANSRAHAATLAHELGMTLVFGEANSAFHIAWLSRLPIRRSANHRQPILAKTLLEIEVSWAGVPLRLFATHLASRHDGSAPVDEIAAIRDVLGPPASTPHLLVGDFNALAPGDPVGDPPPGQEKRGDARDGAGRPAIRDLLAAGYVDCYRALHPTAPGYTYATDRPWLRLDYLFASPELAGYLQMCDLVTSAPAAQASDHFPVWAAFVR